MAQSRIIIIDDEINQIVGGQVKSILAKKIRLKVDLLDKPLVNLRQLQISQTDLIIPVLPAYSSQQEGSLGALLKPDFAVPVLPIIRSEDLERGLDSLFSHTRDFLVSPVREAELLARVRRLMKGNGDWEAETLRARVAETLSLAQLVGEAPGFVSVKQKITRIAQFESTVLVTGETGTGKELCARALHYSSRRAGNAFLPVNCGAIPVDLFENELFGHQKGAFTSAWDSQTGLIAEAEGGTLFLDEIDTLSLSGQVKLLRFLENQSYYVLGSPRARRANVWIIASTNADLSRKVQEGTFRKDLYYRLAVVTLCLPPLRQRTKDIPLLANHFCRVYSKQSGMAVKQLSAGAREVLCAYSWPGNVRELENVIQQSIIQVEHERIMPEDLSIPLPQPGIQVGLNSLRRTKAQVIEQFERAYVMELLRAHGGNVTRAAREANKERRAFGRLIKKYQIEKHQV